MMARPSTGIRPSGKLDAIVCQTTLEDEPANRYHRCMTSSLNPCRFGHLALALLCLTAGSCGGSNHEGSPLLDASSSPADGGGGDMGAALSGFCGALVPSSPSEAFNLDAIKAATLADLNWSQTSSSSANGVTQIDGTFSPGTYTSVIAGGGSTRTITLASQARLYYPEAASGPIPVLVFAAHLATLVPNLADQFTQIAGYGVAVMVQGESSADWNALGYPGTDDQRGALVDDGLADLIARNACALVDLQTSNFPLVLARTNMLALTLAQRLLEENGKTHGTAAQVGGSKEGYATWIVSAVDDRMLVASPENFQRESLDALSAFERNDGCGPNGSSTNVNVPTQLAFRDWLSSIPAGEGAAQSMLVERFIGDRHPVVLLIAGDTGMPGVHDGIWFTMGAETSFLEHFTAKPFRYDRWSAISGDKDAEMARRIALTSYLLTVADPVAEMANWIHVVSAAANDDGTAVSFSVAVTTSPNLTHVYAYWNQSPTREFNNTGQAPWQQIELVPLSQSPTTFVSSQAVIPTAGWEVAWYAEAIENLSVGSVTLARKDASPLKLLRELAPLTCSSYEDVVCPAP